MSFRKRHLYPMLTTSALLAGWVSLGMFWARDVHSMVQKGKMYEQADYKLKAIEHLNSKLAANQVDPDKVQLPREVAQRVVRPLPASYSKLDASCIVVTMVQEAASQGKVGMWKVANVVMARVNQGFESTACNVVTAKGQFEFSHSFPVLKGKDQNAIIKLASEPKYRLAWSVLNEMIIDEKYYVDNTGDATFFANLAIVRKRAMKGDIASRKALDFFGGLQITDVDQDHTFLKKKESLWFAAR